MFEHCGRTTDGPWVYYNLVYKLTYEPLGSGELITLNLKRLKLCSEDKIFYMNRFLLHLIKREVLCFLMQYEMKLMYTFGKIANSFSVSPSPKKGHGKVLKKRALSARGDMQRGHF